MFTASPELKERCQSLRDDVLETIVENFDYFKENKSHLAWAIMNFDMIHQATRSIYGACEDNINDKYREVAARLKGKNEKLFSDAWDVTQGEDLRYCYHDFKTNEKGKGSYGTPLASFAEYTTLQDEVRPDIRERVTYWKQDQQIELTVRIYTARVEMQKLNDLANGWELVLATRYGKPEDALNTTAARETLNRTPKD